MALQSLNQKLRVLEFIVFHLPTVTIPTRFPLVLTNRMTDCSKVYVKHSVQVLNNAWLGVVVAEPLVCGIYVSVIASTDAKGINIFVIRCQNACKHIERCVFLVWSSDLVKAANKAVQHCLFVRGFGFFFQNCCESFWLCMSSHYHEYRQFHSNEIHSCTGTPLTTFK